MRVSEQKCEEEEEEEEEGKQRGSTLEHSQSQRKGHLRYLTAFNQPCLGFLGRVLHSRVRKAFSWTLSFPDWARIYLLQRYDRPCRTSTISATICLDQALLDRDPLPTLFKYQQCSIISRLVKEEKGIQVLI